MSSRPGPSSRIQTWKITCASNKVAILGILERKSEIEAATRSPKRPCEPGERAGEAGEAGEKPGKCIPPPSLPRRPSGSFRRDAASLAVAGSSLAVKVGRGIERTSAFCGEMRMNAVSLPNPDAIPDDAHRFQVPSRGGCRFPFFCCVGLLVPRHHPLRSIPPPSQTALFGVQLAYTLPIDSQRHTDAFGRQAGVCSSDNPPFFHFPYPPAM
jgi:hypothetical protein